MDSTFLKIDTIVTTIQTLPDPYRIGTHEQIGTFDFWGYELGIELVVTIIASIITFTFLKFLDQVIVPYMKKRFYTGKKIDGIWIATVEMQQRNYENSSFQEHLELNQSSKSLSGKCTVTTTKPDSTTSISIYEIKGEIINNYVTLTCVIESDREIGIINYLLNLSSGGNTLIGHALWINKEGTEIMHTKDIEFKISKV